MASRYGLIKRFTTNGALAFKRAAGPSIWSRIPDKNSSQRWLLETATDYGREHTPTGLAADTGILIEPARTNLLLRNREIDNASWTDVSAPTTTANNDVAPDGTLTAETVQDDSGAASEGEAQAAVTGAGTSYTASVFAKINSGTSGLLVLWDGSAYATSSAVASTATTWTRVDVTDAAADVDAGVELYPAATGISGGAITPVANTGTAAFWLPQLEAGLWPSSPILTEGTTQTRLAERIEITSASTEMQKDTGSVHFEFFPAFASTEEAGVVVLFSYSASLYLYYDGVDDKFGIYNGSQNDEATARSFSRWTRFMCSLSWGPTGAVMTVTQAGVSAIVLATFTPPGSIPATMYLGSDTAGANGAGGVYRDLLIAGSTLA